MSEVSFPGCIQSFGFLKAGKGPKLTKENTKVGVLYTKSEMVIWRRPFVNPKP